MRGRSGLHFLQRCLEYLPKVTQIAVIRLPVGRHLKPDDPARCLGLSIPKNWDNGNPVSPAKTADQFIDRFECLIQGLPVNASADIDQNDDMPGFWLLAAAKESCGKQ